MDLIGEITYRVSVEISIKGLKGSSIVGYVFMLVFVGGRGLRAIQYIESRLLHDRKDSQPLQIDLHPETLVPLESMLGAFRVSAPT
jgi:hypothetical protein